MMEVTTTNGKSLSSFGLTSRCPLSLIVFDEIVFKPQGSSASDSISPDDKSSRTPPPSSVRFSRNPRRIVGKSRHWHLYRQRTGSYP
jgi:hypothetical protein